MGKDYYSVRAELAVPGGMIEVIEPTQPREGQRGSYYPALLNVGVAIVGFAAEARVSSRGPDGIAQQITMGCSGSRYLIARFTPGHAESHAEAEGQILAAARVLPTQILRLPRKLRKQQAPFANIQVLETASDALFSEDEHGGSEHIRRCRAAADGILYALAAENGMEHGFVQLTGRYGEDFETNGEPRNRTLFERRGFQQVLGAPDWGTKGGLMVAAAQAVRLFVAEAYRPTLQSA